MTRNTRRCPRCDKSMGGSPTRPVAASIAASPTRSTGYVDDPATEKVADLCEQGGSDSNSRTTGSGPATGRLGPDTSRRLGYEALGRKHAPVLR